MALEHPTRRLLLAIGAGSAAIAATRTASAAPRDLTDPAFRLRAYMLMRGALDGQLVIGCITGRYYGVVGSEVRPLYGVVAATFSRYRAAADGGYTGASYEVPYFTDLESGRVLKRWTNPYTNEEVEVPTVGYPPAKLAISPDLVVSLPAPPPGLTMDHHVLPAETIGGDVWMVEETFAAIQFANAPEPIRYTEILTLHANRADLDADVARVPCQTSFQSIVGWRPWLKMAGRPGHLSGNGFGRYGVTMNEVPANWQAATAEFRPDILKDPAAPLVPLLQG